MVNRVKPQKVSTKTKQNNVKILSEYQKKADEIIRKMLQVLIQAQRKADDKAYREALQKIEKLKNKNE